MKNLIIILVVVFAPSFCFAIDSVALTDIDIKQIQSAKKQIETAEQKFMDIQIQILKRELPFRADIPDSFLRSVINTKIHNGKMYYMYNKLTSEQMESLLYYQKAAK